MKLTNNLKSAFSLLIVNFFVAFLIDTASRCPTAVRDALILSSISAIIFYIFVICRDKKF